MLIIGVRKNNSKLSWIAFASEIAGYTNRDFYTSVFLSKRKRIFM
jgi:hypothetical protein